MIIDNAIELNWRPWIKLHCRSIAHWSFVKQTNCLFIYLFPNPPLFPSLIQEVVFLIRVAKLHQLTVLVRVVIRDSVTALGQDPPCTMSRDWAPRARTLHRPCRSRVVPSRRVNSSLLLRASTISTKPRRIWWDRHRSTHLASRQSPISRRRLQVNMIIANSF